MREGFEGTGELVVVLRPFDRVGSGLPAQVGLAQRPAAGCWAVEVAVCAAAGGVDHVRVAQVLEETGQSQRVHAAGDDRGGRPHPVPLLEVRRALVLLALTDVGDRPIIGGALHLAVAHGADVDPRRALQPRHLRQHVRGVTTLRTRRRHRPVTGPVIMQVLPREIAAGGRDHTGPADITINQERHLVRVRTEHRQNEFAPGDHFRMIIGGDIRAEQLRLTGLVHRPLHGVVHQRNSRAQRRENLVALRLVILDEIPTQPEFVRRPCERLRPQPQLGLDDRACDVAAVLDRTAQDAPQIRDPHRRPVEQLDRPTRHVEVVHLGVLDVTHALVVPDRQRQERHHHHPAVDDVPIEQLQRVGDPHLFGRLVNQVHQRVQTLGEIVRRRHLHIRPRRRLSSKMSGRLHKRTRLLLHLVSTQDVPTTSDEFVLAKTQIDITGRLIHDDAPS